MIKRLILFLILNFGALAIGSIFTGDGVSSLWYQQLDKAPWTPPGWVFGAAWTIIMVCFTIFMAYAVRDVYDINKLFVLFIIQWLLNVLWNPAFFHFQDVTLALFIITSLTLLIGFFIATYRKELKFKIVLLFPYMIWLLIATSLNGYIFLYN